MLKKSILFMLVFCLSTAVQAGWLLDNDNSWLSFLFVKKQNVAETGMFTKLAGVVDDSGKAELSIDLASVNTNIEIRDDRMQNFLFETSEHPKAVLTAKLDMEKISQLVISNMMIQPITVQLNLHGSSQKIESNVVITRLAEDRILVVNQSVLAVKAAEFGLLKGIEVLRQLAGLPSISPIASVSFVFTFKKN